jgi:transcriptional regulator with XRE-family HTH domain
MTDSEFHRFINNNPDIRDSLKIIEWKPSQLKEIRESLGISQTKMAEIILCSHPTISAIENGTSHNPFVSTLYGIFLERLWAFKHEMIPGYRKIGSQETFTFII